MTIVDLLENNASKFSSSICITEKNCNITWSEFNVYSNKLANWFIKNSVQKDDKIAIIMKNCIEWLPIYFAILKSGAIAVPINYNYDEKEIAYCVQLAECSIVICSQEYSKEAAYIKKLKPAIKFIVLDGDSISNLGTQYNEILSSSSSLNPNITVFSDDLAAIYFSSGTTGFPKAVLIKHQSLFASAITEQKHHRQNIDDKFLIIAPLYHTGAIIHWFGSLLVGGSAVLLNNTLPDVVLETISDKKITIAWLLLPLVQDILDAIDSEYISLDNYNLSLLRLIHMGAQPIPSSVIRKFHEMFPNQTFDKSYGLTEATGPGCVNLGFDNYEKIDSIGKAGFGWKAEILTDDKIAPSNVSGELIVKGDGVMVEYYNDPSATKKVLENGWLHTGDLAYKDDDGYIYLIGRKKDLIISGGENIYPIQIEDYLRGHPAVKDVAVIGMPNKRLGEVIAAAIELKPEFSCTKFELNRYCEGLPIYKRPYRIYFANIPRSATGKIDKNRLKKELFGVILDDRCNKDN